MRHQMRLKDAPFQMIWDGEKMIELRLLDEKKKIGKHWGHNRVF